MKYNVQCRDLQGNVRTIFNVTIPQPGLLTIQDYADTIARRGLIYLSCSPVNGLQGASPMDQVGRFTNTGVPHTGLGDGVSWNQLNEWQQADLLNSQATYSADSGYAQLVPGATAVTNPQSGETEYISPVKAGKIAPVLDSAIQQSIQLANEREALTPKVNPVTTSNVTPITSNTSNTPQVKRDMPVLRLIYSNPNGFTDTGATYPGCSLNNPDACKPVQFSSVIDAVNYANAHGEIPTIVTSPDQAWRIVNGTEAPPPPYLPISLAKVGMYGLGAYLVYKLLGRKTNA